MDEIRELAQRLNSLTEEELANLRQLVVARSDELDTDEATADDTAELVELGDLADSIMQESQTREVKAQELREAREGARERVQALNPQAEAEPESEDGAPEPEGEEPEAEPQAEAEVEQEQPAEAVVASTGTEGIIGKLARHSARGNMSPDQLPDRVTGVLTASTGYQRGREISDREDLAREMGEVITEQIHSNALNVKTIVASARVSYPPERKLGADADENTRKMEAITGMNAPKYDPATGALVATGGICQPVNVDYSVPTWAVADRPIKDALPSFEATRGGIKFVTPPDLAEWEGATGVWTETTDASPGGETKPVKVLACGTEQNVFVEAVSTRVGFGNMQSRFAPEQVAANTDLAIAAASRVAENNLLKRIEENCLKNLLFEHQQSLARDLFAQMDACVASYQSIHRLGHNQAYTVILPFWVQDLIRIDIMREQAHDNAGSWNVWEISDEQIDSLFKRRNINVIWHLDGQPTNGSKYKNQILETPGEGNEGTAFDKTASKLLEAEFQLVWYFFAEGQIQFLDAGRLDLGVVRDSTLDATNDYETFVETFEGIAFRGFAKGAWQCVSKVNPVGVSAIAATAPSKPV